MRNTPIIPEMPSSLVHTKVRYSLGEAAELLSTSLGTLYRRIGESRIESHMDSKRRFVSAHAIDSYVASCKAETSSLMPAWKSR